MPRTEGVSSRVRTRCILLRPKTDQRCALDCRTADGRTDLLDRDRLCFSLLRSLEPWLRLLDSSAASPAQRDGPGGWHTSGRAEQRRPSDASGCFRASNVARTMLYGFDEPIDLATTSCMPSVSKTARIGPPAMMPVPAGGGAQQNLAGAMTAVDVVMQRAAVAQRNDESCRAWQLPLPCGWLPALHAPCHGRSQRDPSGRRRRRGLRSRNDGRP